MIFFVNLALSCFWTVAAQVLLAGFAIVVAYIIYGIWTNALLHGLYDLRFVTALAAQLGLKFFFANIVEVKFLGCTSWGLLGFNGSGMLCSLQLYKCSSSGFVYCIQYTLFIIYMTILHIHTQCVCAFQHRHIWFEKDRTIVVSELFCYIIACQFMVKHG